MAPAIQICPACGQSVPLDSDFCSCGEYLHWELDPETVAGDLDPPPAPPSPQVQRATPVHPMAAVPSPSAAAVLTLRPPGGRPPGGAVLRQTVTPGAVERVVARLRNASAMVDSYDIALDGLPADWFSIEPERADLLPSGSGASAEREVEIRLHPPRSPDAEARVWRLELSARSRSSGHVVATVPLAVEIESFGELGTTLRPGRVRARRRAAFTLVVANNGNAPAHVALQGRDPDDVLRFDFDRPAHEVPPGREVVTRMWVTASQPIWIGGSEDHPFEVRTFTSVEGLQAWPASGFMRQVAWLSWAEMAALAGVALLLVLVLMLV